MKREISSLERSLYRRFAQAVRDYDLIHDGDHIMVAISGGKDSYAMLHFLHTMRKRAPVKFELTAVHLDQAQPGYDGTPLEGWLQAKGYPHRILRRDTYSIVKEKTSEGQAYCFMCSRLRRGILYQTAVDMGCNKIALGHHRDDALETLMLNLIFTGQMKSMPPKLISDDRRNTVIRPLIYCGEAELHQFSAEMQFPILPCNLCGSQENLQRKAVRRWLDQIEAANPGARSRMLAGLTNVRPTHLLDKKLYNALGLPGLMDEPGTAGAERVNGKAHGALKGTSTGPDEGGLALDEAAAHHDPADVIFEEPLAGDNFSLEPIDRVFHDALGAIE